MKRTPLFVSLLILSACLALGVSQPSPDFVPSPTDANPTFSCEVTTGTVLNPDLIQNITLIQREGNIYSVKDGNGTIAGNPDESLGQAYNYLWPNGTYVTRVIVSFNRNNSVNSITFQTNDGRSHGDVHQPTAGFVYDYTAESGYGLVGWSAGFLGGSSETQILISFWRPIWGPVWIDENYATPACQVEEFDPPACPSDLPEAGNETSVNPKIVQSLRFFGYFLRGYAIDGQELVGMPFPGGPTQLTADAYVDAVAVTYSNGFVSGVSLHDSHYADFRSYNSLGFDDYDLRSPNTTIFSRVPGYALVGFESTFAVPNDTNVAPLTDKTPLINSLIPLWEPRLVNRTMTPCKTRNIEKGIPNNGVSRGISSSTLLTATLIIVALVAMILY